jgi:hypothetical protein
MFQLVELLIRSVSSFIISSYQAIFLSFEVSC